MQRAWVHAARSIDPLINSGEIGRARARAKWFLRFFRSEPEAWVLLARTYSNGGAWGEAEKIVREGLARLPDSIELSTFLAVTLNAQGRVEEAQAWSEEMRERYPDSPYPLIWLAVVAIQKRRFEEAELAIREGLDRIDEGASPSLQVDQLTHLGLNLVQIPGKKDEAIAVLKRAAGIPGLDDPRPHMLLGLLLEGPSLESKQHLEVAQTHWRGDEESFQRNLEMRRRALLKVV